MKKIFLLITAIFGLTFSSTFLYAQHLFSVSQNDVSKENVALLKNQIVKSDITTLSLTKNNENRNVYPVALSSAQNTKIIILNEQTGNHVVITPADESLTEFQLAPFFIEELRQGALGNANQYLVIEATLDFSVKNVATVAAAKRDVFIPQYFYGKKENVKEALPKDRQIIHIFKQKPRFILASTKDSEFLQYIAQLEEEMSYYVYMYKLPDGGLWIYDEHFNKDNHKNETKVGEQLEFILSGNLNATQEEATLYALNIWSEVLSGSVPVDISVMSINLGNPYVIGQSFRMPNYWNPETETWYCSALGNQMAGYNVVPNQKDIRLEMNSQFNFYYQITGNPGYSQIDWITTMLHEACHGLGFYPLVGSDGAYSYTTPSGGGASTNYPGIYDRQLFQGLTGPCLTDLTQSQRAALVTSSNLYSGAPESNLLEANGGVRIQMYAPSSWQPGSSVSHWNTNVSFPTFMRYYIDYGWKLHTIGTRKIGMMLDLGWTQPIINPNSSWVTFMANGGTGNMSKQQFLPGEAQNLRANVFKKEGYTFANWNTLSDGTGDSYTDKQSITISNDMNLYAQWEANTYILTFNPNGGTVDPTSKQVTYGAPVGELPVPVRTGYQFNEWRYGPTPITEETIWIYTDNITVTASWTSAAYIITATATEGGTISPSGSSSVPHGSNRTYTITPNEEHIIFDVLVDGASVGAVSEYVFSNVIAPHTIHAVFKGLNIAESQRIASLQIIPNPANHTIELRIKNYELQIEQIEFYNLFGQLVKSVPFTGQTTKDEASQKINISDLTAGVYMVKAGGKAVKLVVN